MAEVTFGEWLKRRRRGMGLTQQQLAAQINYSTISIKKIEAEERRPSTQIVERLVEIFNIPPSEHTKFLRFARGDWKSAPSETQENFPWQASTKSLRSNLPASITSLIGREQEIASVHEYLSNPSVRLITLIGPPGIGKTRLSIEAARAELSYFPDGVFFIALATLENPSLVAPTIAQTLGLVEATDQLPIKRLENGIGDKRILLVLDNVEHLIEGTANIVSDLLLACTQLKILTTSREALRVPGEWLYTVPTLGFPTDTQLQSMGLKEVSEFAALNLFTERARAVRSDFVLNIENVQAVASICTQLDGLPLAIELIAARIRLMSPESLLSHLSAQFTLYADGMRAVSARQKTLHNAISWSYDLLPAKEQILFRRLAAFVGGWALEDAQAVCSDESLDIDKIPDLLMHLVDKSLVIVQEKKGVGRYSSLETVRQYAREKLWAVGEGDVLRQRHLAYFVDLAEQAEPNLRAFDMVMWLNRLEEELDNIRVALESALECNIEAQLRIASSLLWFWHIRGHKNEGAEWLEKGLSIEAAKRGDKFLNPQHAMIRGKALNASGALRLMLNDNDKGSAFSEESLRIFQGLGPIGKQGMAYALLNLSKVANQQMDLKRQKTLLEESLSLFQETGDRFGMAECIGEFVVHEYNENDLEQTKILLEKVRALREEIGDKDGTAGLFIGLGYLAYQLSDYEQATLHFETSVVLFREIGNRWALGEALSNLARVAQAQGDYKRTIIILEEALVLAQDLGEKHTIADRLFHLGFAARSQGDYQRAIVMQEGALALVREFGDQALVSKTLCWLGLAALDQNQHQQAINRFDEALTISMEIGEHFVTAFAYCCKARVAQAQNDFATARELYFRAISLFLGYDAPLNVLYGGAFCLEGLAILAVTESDMKQAGCLFSASEKFFPRLRSEMSARERTEHDQAIATAHAALGEEAFAAAREEGRAMTIEQAIAYALEESGD